MLWQTSTLAQLWVPVSHSLMSQQEHHIIDAQSTLLPSMSVYVYWHSWYPSVHPALQPPAVYV